jgi:ribonuclease Z
MHGMSTQYLETGLSWQHKDLTLFGYSLAGISTSVVFPAADVCFDVAQGLSYQIPINTILITHGHLDHAGGIPYLLGQKSMRGAKAPVIYMPHALLAPMQKIMQLWGEIEDHTYNYTFQPIAPGEEAQLKGPFFFRPFPTFHRVPSQGYTIFQRKKRLKKEFLGLHHSELGVLRRKGKVLEEHYEEPQVSFTGDTRIEFMESEQVRNSRVLVMEVTYWDERKSVANAREWGHIHMDELLPRLDELKCEKIVLIHTSVRYTTEYLKGILEKRLPEQHKHRVELFPRPN